MRNTFLAALLALCLNVLVRAAEVAPDPAYVALAKNIEAAALKQDKKAVEAAFDIEAYCRRIRGDNTEDQKFFEEFTGGFKESAQMGQALLAAAESASLQFLRVRVDKGLQLGLYRISSSAGFNYIELLFSKDGAGNVRVVDTYMYVNGEFMSETMRVIYQNGLRQSNPSIFKKLFGSSAVDVSPKMQIMAQHIQAGKNQEALDVYNTIPKERQNWKPLLNMRIRASSGISQEAWLEAINDYERAYPNDVSLNFVKLDANLILKKFDEALKAVDALEKALEGDAFLNSVRANICHMQGRSAEGAILAQKAGYCQILWIGREEKSRDFLLDAVHKANALNDVR